MPSIKTPIIPIKQTFVKVKDEPEEIDYQAICLFAATGFFWDDMTYWKNKKVLRPGTINEVDKADYLIDSKPWFKWYYAPKDQDLQTSVDQHQELLEQIIEEQVGDQPVILPLSGGLDSRSQAVALHKLGRQVQSYSYSFQGGYKEHEISKQIAQICNFDFQSFEIPPSYLWDKIDELGNINLCYSEFTHPRQMAVLEEFKKMQGVFSLGHWGDVLFDQGGDEGISDSQLVSYIHKKVVKKGGMELAEALWRSWDLEGDFKSYIQEKTQTLLDRIAIQNTSAKVRAFKSMYWAPRWTSINLSIFEAAHSITLPYYDDRMCQLICEIPEAHLANRQIQIEYIKQNNRQVAQVTWQDHRPFHLFNYQKNKAPYNLPYRIQDKLKRVMNEQMGKKFIQRNWELQFLGQENKKKLLSYIEDPKFKEFIDPKVIQTMYNKFKREDAVYYSHAVSMLLTLSVFNKKSMKK